MIIDSSGFAYGDFWGYEKAGLRLANQVKKWKRQGKKVVMLPQAFGPFTDPKLRQKMATILKHADLIFARDKYSYDYLTEVSPADSGKVHQFPDFTNLGEGIVPANFDNKKHQVAVIPNIKMLEADMFESAKDYHDLLVLFINEIRSYNLNPYFLLHEGNRDKRIVEDVNKLLSTPVPVVEEEDPFVIKGVIKASYAVIGSRFHGLVSSLSQAIPSLCVGWSHKYEALFNDYNFPEGLLSAGAPDEALIKEKMKLILDKDEREGLLKKLESASQEQKQLTAKMWEKVFEVIS